MKYFRIMEYLKEHLNFSIDDPINVFTLFIYHDVDFRIIVNYPSLPDGEEWASMWSIDSKNNIYCSTPSFSALLRASPEARPYVP